MTAFVLDASVAVAWAFQDELTPLSEKALNLLGRGTTAVVSDLWALEVANALLVAEKRKRISSSNRILHQEMLQMLPLESRPLSMRHVFDVVASLAHEHGLTLYDALYLDLALRENLPLATLDKQLMSTARKLKLKPFV